MYNTMRILIVCLCLLCSAFPMAFAKPAEWKDSAYNFKKVKTILIMSPEYVYGKFDVSGNNKFEKYPDTEAKMNAMLNNRWKKIAGFRYVSLPWIVEQIKANPENSITEFGPGLTEELIKEIPKYADLVAFTRIHDFGWFYEYREAYDSTETVIDRVRYGGVTPDGKEYSGWMEIPRSVVVHHAADYTIYDSAEARFELLDARSWKPVWKYSDARDRLSISFSREYDPSGPESMMNRILNVAFDKLPVLP